MPYSLVIFLCILGAGAAVLIGFATIRFYRSREDDSGEPVLPVAEAVASQAIYMREVRTRNQYDISKMTGHGHGFRSEEATVPPSSRGGERAYYGGGQQRGNGNGGGYYGGGESGVYYQGSAVSGAGNSTPALNKAWQ